MPPGTPKAINVEYLKKYLRIDQEEGELRRDAPPPRAERDEEEEEWEWEVEDIIGHRGTPARREYRIKWKGYPTATWAKEHDLTGCDELLEEYWERQNRAAAPSPRRLRPRRSP